VPQITFNMRLLAAGVRFSLRHGDQADGGENGRVLLVFLNGQSFSFPGCRDILYDERDVESATFVRLRRMLPCFWKHCKSTGVTDTTDCMHSLSCRIISIFW
jgi:hypothetical protein